MQLHWPLVLTAAAACAAGPETARPDGKAGAELSAVIDELRRIADEAPGLELPAQLELRVVELCHTLQPDGTDGLSRERGDLLLALLATRLDVSGVVAAADFSGADLRDAVLAGRDLRDQLAEMEFSDAYSSPEYVHGRHLFSVVLRGVELTGADLTRIDLHAADLSDARLVEAVLAEADLRRAVLNRADLRDADLRGADLRGASLFEADLRGADLRGADLEDANLRGARRGSVHGATPDSVPRLSPDSCNAHGTPAEALMS